ncbi:MAG: hypothetical protein V9E83_03115 [Baekduia sp.]
MTGRLLGEHFGPDGRPKRAYDTWVMASAFAAEYGLVAYECTVCGKWHLASPPDERKKR